MGAFLHHSLEDRTRAEMVLPPFAETKSLTLSAPKGQVMAKLCIKIIGLMPPYNSETVALTQGISFHRHTALTARQFC